MLNQLLGTVSVSGHEEELHDCLRENMQHSYDEIYTDSIRNLAFTHKGITDKRVLLAAHGDEIGLMVTGYTEDGFLRVTNVGGVKARLYPGSAVQIQTAQGVVSGIGVVDTTKLNQEKFEVSDLRIDIGASTKEEAKAAVGLGDVMVVETQVKRLLNGRIAARGLDDRSGVFIIMEALKRVHEAKGEHTVIGAITAGEEVGKHGAKWIAERMNVTESIVIDVTYTSDSDGWRDAKWGDVSLGKGPVLCINPICNKRMNQTMENLAKEHGIPLQYEITAGNTHTDADEVHLASKGIDVAIVYLPLRYMHSPYEVADEKDIEHCIQLLTAYLLHV